jgi:putative membrane-bound dehydrogenase-like protein
VTPLRTILVLAFFAPFAAHYPSEEPPRTGPQTEKRFPPLKLPRGFTSTLFACDPLIEYPSVIAAGPKANNLFVAIDYMTGLGEEIIRHDEIRLIEDTDGDGYADKSTVFAKGFNSIQGLAYHDGNLYVMHAPFLTVLRDTKGAGVADERRDLLKGLGLAPEVNKTRLHCANGVVVGHDGWLYLAMGDNGLDVKRPEGDRLILNGGGILRCRPDGTDLHIFATGLRNIYDVALDAELNVFVRDNENDGGAYKIRVCHSAFGSDHGYPYLYYERPDEALPPLADLGLGSSAGGVCYLEPGFPTEYRNNLFFCEWGRSVVRYVPQHTGSAFGPVKEIEFAFAAENDPYGFKPTDIVVQRDGAMLIADWADGQRPKRGRGRIYRVTSTDTPLNTQKLPPTDDLIARLQSESYYIRTDAQFALEKKGAAGLKLVQDKLHVLRSNSLAMGHAVWILARGEGSKSLTDLFELAKPAVPLAVRIQAVRAIADLTDPVLVKHKLDAGAGDVTIAAKLAALGEGEDASFQREVVIALGRLKWASVADWIAKHVKKPDAALAHAAMQALRQVGNWPDVLKLLDRPGDAAIRTIALHSVAERRVSAVVDGLIERLKSETVAARRMEYADALCRVHRKPGPWVYWGYRPGPRPANTVDWERTAAIGAALDRALTDSAIRVAVLKSMQLEKVPPNVDTLASWLRDERAEQTVGLLLESLRNAPIAKTRDVLLAVVREKEYGTQHRQFALKLFATNLDATSASQLLPLTRGLEDGPVLAEVLRLLGRHPELNPAAILTSRSNSPVAEVRAAVIEAIAELKAPEGKELVVKLLADEKPEVRRAAARAAGKFAAKESVELLLKLCKDEDSGVRAASLESLRQLREPRAVPLAVAALDDRVTQLPALELLGVLGSAEQTAAVIQLTRRAPPADVLAAAVRVLTAWGKQEGLQAEKRRELERAIAEIQGTSGVLLRWTVGEPIAKKDVAAITERFAPVPSADADPAPAAGWHSVLATSPEWRVTLPAWKSSAAESVAFGFTDVIATETTAVEFTLSGAGTAEIWLNGKSLYRRDQAANNQNTPVRFGGELAKGTNRVLVQIGSPRAVEFSLSFRRKSSTALHEKLTQAALTQTGNVERGRKVFFDAEKSLCVKCHRVGEQGERVGPELTGIGARFGRVYLVESILEPSRTVVPGFATQRVELKDGRIFTGVKVAETDSTLTLIDSEIKKHELKKADIFEQKLIALSTMPEGLEKRLTEQEFVDLIAYLVSLKERGG